MSNSTNKPKKGRNSWEPAGVSHSLNEKSNYDIDDNKNGKGGALDLEVGRKLDKTPSPIDRD